MDHADNVVEAPAVDRQIGIAAAGELIHDLIPVGVQIDALDAVARHHDVVHGDFLEIEDGEQHVLVRLGNQHVGLAHQRPQLFGGDLGRGLFPDRDAEEAQCPVGDDVGEPHQRIKREQQRAQDVGRGVGDALRVERGERLGGDLGKHQHHERQQRRRDGERPLAVYLQRDQRGDKRGGDVGEVVAEQDHPEQPIGALEELARQTRAAMSGLRLAPQAVAVQGHQADFSCGEERGQQDEENQGGDERAERVSTQGQWVSVFAWRGF